VKQQTPTTVRSPNVKRKDGVDKRERTRRALIETSLRLIAEKGIEETSVLEVTNALGISNGAFYYHFRNKDHLLEEVGHAVVESVVGKIESVSRADPAAQVARGPHIVLRYYLENIQLRPIMLRVVVDQSGNHESLHNKLHEHVARGRLEGRFDIADVDLAVAFCRAIIAGALQKYTPGCDAALLGKQTSAHTLAMLGLPLREAFALAQDEYESIEAEADEL
jgi:AcrR family transcriptional regulator